MLSVAFRFIPNSHYFIECFRFPHICIATVHRVHVCPIANFSIYIIQLANNWLLKMRLFSGVKITIEYLPYSGGVDDPYFWNSSHNRWKCLWSLYIDTCTMYVATHKIYVESKWSLFPSHSLRVRLINNIHANSSLLSPIITRQ